MIGNNIVITVLEVRRNRIKLGFDCPENVQVLRAEVHQRAGQKQWRSVPVACNCDLSFISESA